jgi:hypothetical protein
MNRRAVTLVACAVAATALAVVALPWVFGPPASTAKPVGGSLGSLLTELEVPNERKPSGDPPAIDKGAACSSKDVATLTTLADSLTKNVAESMARIEAAEAKVNAGVEKFRSTYPTVNAAELDDLLSEMTELETFSLEKTEAALDKLELFVKGLGRCGFERSTPLGARLEDLGDQLDAKVTDLVEKQERLAGILEQARAPIQNALDTAR